MDEPFFHRKPRDILLFLRGKKKANVSEVAARTKSTYAHCFNLIKELEELGAVATSREGRSRVVTLTKMGEDLAELIADFMEVLRGGRRSTEAGRFGRETAHHRLIAYHKKLCRIEEEAKKPGAERAKLRRLLGRYRYLVRRVRPRSEADRRLKKETLEKIDSIIKHI